jgi:hypothetical protein
MKFQGNCPTRPEAEVSRRRKNEKDRSAGSINYIMSGGIDFCPAIWFQIQGIGILLF